MPALDLLSPASTLAILAGGSSSLYFPGGLITLLLVLLGVNVDESAGCSATSFSGGLLTLFPNTREAVPP
jgi:hypothetical protein